MKVNVKYLQSRLSRNYRNDTIWANVSASGDIDIDFIRQFKDRLNWKNLCWNHNVNFTEEFIEEFADYIDWRNVSNSVSLPDKLIFKYADKLYFNQMAKWNCWNLSEAVVDRFGDQMDWGYISFKMTMSNSFIKRHRNKLGIDFLDMNPNIPTKLFKLLEKLREEGKFKAHQYYEGTGMKEIYEEAVKKFNSLPEIDEYFAKVK